MKSAFSPALRKCPALILVFVVASAWLFSSCGLSGKDLSSVKDWFSGKGWSTAKEAETFYESGCRDFQSGARQAAIDEFTKAIQLDPSLAPAYSARAGARYQMGDYTNAISDCDKVIEFRQDDERIYLIKGACHFYLHDLKGARNILSTAISLNPDDPIARDVHGLASLELRDWNDAVGDFTNAIRINPDDAKAYYGCAAAEFFLNEYEKSLADASDAIELLDSSVAPDAYTVRAIVKSNLKDHAGALADANSRINLNPSDAKGYLVRGTIELEWDDFAGASNDLQTAVGINPTNSEIYLHRGELEHKLRKFDAALADYTQGLQYDTDAFHGPEIYKAIGYVHAEMGQWQPALDAFRKATTANSPSDDARFEIYVIECRLGQTEQAKKELAVYIQSIPAANTRDWTTSIAHFLAGTSNETNFLAQATSTAKRPTDIPMQTGDAWYFAGMVHLLAGDEAGALERFKECLKVGDDNSHEVMLARSIVEFWRRDKSISLPAK